MSDGHKELTPNERAYICKLWRLRERTARDRAFKRSLTITATVAVIAIVLSSVAGGSEWPPGILWVLGFAVGSFYAMAAVNLRSWRAWSALASIIDWKRVEEVATAESNLHKN